VVPIIASSLAQGGSAPLSIRVPCRTWDDATHPAYKMSPFARAKKPTGCQICRKKRERRPSTVEIAA